MAVSAAYDLRVSVTETGLTFGSELVQTASLIHELGTRAQGVLNATSTGHDGTTSVPATKVYSDQVALAVGAATVDFTSMTDYAGTALTFDGLKIQLLFLENDPANANLMTFDDGAANAYLFFGAAAGHVTLLPGQAVLLFGNDAMADVSSTVKNMDVGGTGSQVFNIIAVAG